MKLDINRDRCEGHARCMALAPDSFDLDDADRAFVTAPGGDVPDDVAHAVIAACPERAIFEQGERI